MSNNDFEINVIDAFDGLWVNVKITSHPEGEYDPLTGKFIPGDTTKSPVEEGVILPLSADDLVHEEGGTVTRNSQKLYIYEKLQQGQKLKRVETGEEFEIQEEKDYSRAAGGLHVYIIRQTGVAGK